MDNNDIPYLMRGVQNLTTDSSSLISSSPYLNEPRLRDWLATHFLRRSGKDLPTTSDSYKLHIILRDIYDIDHIEALFEANRKTSPALDRWLGERFVSTYSLQDLLSCPEHSLGYTFGKYLSENGYEIDIVPRFEPRNHLEYYMLRSGQTHDLEHIIAGGNFDILGELVPYFARLSNVPRFLDEELAGHLNAGQLLGALRIVTRTGLHYQQAFPTTLKAMQAGMHVGEQSGPMFMFKYEDVFHLPIPAAREALGVRDVMQIDTHEASKAWPEYR